MEPLFTVAVVLFALAIFWQALGHGRAIERLYNQLNAGKPNTWVSDGGTTYNLAEASEIVEMDGELVKVQVVGTLGMTEEDCRRSLHTSLGQQGLRIATTNPDASAPLWESAEEKSLGSLLTATMGGEDSNLVVSTDAGWKSLPIYTPTAEEIERAWTIYEASPADRVVKVRNVVAAGRNPTQPEHVVTGFSSKLTRTTFVRQLTEGFAKSHTVVFYP